MRRWRVSLFDQLVDEALKSRAELSTLRPVVEKELLHHDILRELGAAAGHVCAPVMVPRG